MKNTFVTKNIILFLLFFSFTGCRNNDNTNQTAIIAEQAINSQQIFEKKDKTFAIVYPLMHPFFTETNKGAREKAEELSVNLVLLGPRFFSIEEQIASMEKLIDSGVDGIGIGAFDPEQLTPVIDKAIERGIPVISFDTDAPDSRRLSFISTDNMAQGRHLGQITADILKGKGKVIISQGVPTQLNLNERLEGVKESLAEYPDIEILEISAGYGNQQKTISSIESMIENHPDFNALIGLDAEAGPSAVIVWRSRGLSQDLIVSEDMDETMKGIRDGIVTATITQEQYRWGSLIVQRLYDVTMGKTLSEYETTDTKKINIENIDEYYPED